MGTLDFDGAKQLYETVGIHGRVGFGERPAILLVDFQYILTRGGLSGGNILEAVRNSRRFIDVARERRIPLIYTYVAYRDDFKDSGIWGRKAPGLAKCVHGSKAVEIDEMLTPGGEDLVICKKMASAFFGTALLMHLVKLRVDTLIVTGNSTSGCVRASVVDACSYGYRVIVPEECVGDRHEAPHQANLFDMGAKYADVLPLEEVLEYIMKIDVWLEG